MKRKTKVFALLLLLIIAILISVEVKGQGQFVGSKNSDVYHYPWCPYAESILDENKIWFDDAQDAVNQGYRPCKVCNPPLPDSQEPTTEPEPTEPESPTGDIINVFVNDVIDGDTFDTAEGYRIRLADIDAPEIGETGYLESTEYLELLVEDKSVILDIDSITGTDPYGRYVCLVFVEYNSTHCMNVNQALVNGGYAEVDDYTNNEFDPTKWLLYCPTSTIPEFPSYTLLLVSLTVVAVVLAIYKRKLNIPIIP